VTRWTVLVAAALTAALPAPVSAATSQDAAAALLERSRREAHDERFDGVVTVLWRADGEEHAARVVVRSTSAGIEVGGDAPHLVGQRDRRLLRGQDGWERLWAGGLVAAHPPVTAKYELALLPSAPVAGRPCRVVEARRAGKVRERLYIDELSGLLLRREQVDPSGRIERTVGFEVLDEPDTDPHPTGPARGHEPVPAKDVDRPFHKFHNAGAGYQLLGAYRERGSVLHLLYGDGLHGLSVFEQQGRLDRRGLPLGGREVDMGGHRVVLYELPSGQLVVWPGNGVVFTLVSDAPADDIAAVVARFPHGGPVNRMVRTARRLAALFRWR
jgi:hypothetical protein